jgi:rubrerythrin
MNTQEELIEAMSELAQVDIDALHAYSQALEQIEDEVIRSRLEEFMAQHREHIDRLSAAIKELGGQPPAFSKDFKGFFIEGFTALRSSTGMIGALKALRTTEEITHRYYAKAVPMEAPARLKDIYRRHLSEERIHLDYVVSNLEALG